MYAKDTTYYNSQWKQTTKAKSSFYRISEKKNGKWFVEDYYNNGQLQMKGTLLTRRPDIRDGEFKFYDKNGNLIEKGTYKGDLKHGEYIFYYKNGNKELVENWNHGVQHGEIAAYQEDGTISYKGSYKNGKRYGKWIYYDFFGKEDETRIFHDKISLKPAGIEFAFPNDKWYAISSGEKDDKVKFDFNRLAIERKKGDYVKPLLSVIIEKNVNNQYNLTEYSVSRIKGLNLKIIDDLQKQLKVRDALGYKVEYKSSDGTLLHSYVIFVHNNEYMMQMYIETTADTFKDVENEFNKIVRSLKKI